jgi:hypothetical protein
MTDLRLAQLPDGDLEAVLRGLAPAVDWPSADRGPGQPDLAAAVRARIEAAPRPVPADAPRRGWRPTWRPARRALVLAVIALLALAAIAGAIGIGLPGLRFIFGPAPVSPPPSVEPIRSPAPAAGSLEPSVSGSPALGVPGSSMGLGERVELADLDARAGFHVRWPNDPAVGPPDAAYVDDLTGGQVTLVWAATPDLPATLEPGVGLLFSQFQGKVDEGFFNKSVDNGTTIQPVTVGGHAGYWLSGDPHMFFWQAADGFVDDQRRWVGDTLLWSDGEVTFRLETSLGRDAAIRLAQTLG